MKQPINIPEFSVEEFIQSLTQKNSDLKNEIEDINKVINFNNELILVVQKGAKTDEV